MLFNPKCARVILKTVGVAVVIFLGITASSSFAEPSANVVRAYATSGSPQAGDACQPLFAAMGRNLTTPYHTYMTMTGGSAQNGKARNTETISIGETTYVLANGKWISNPVSAEDKKEAEEELRKMTKAGTCQYVRDESVNGENAALFATHNKTEIGTHDNQIWVSKSKGLIVKQETDIDTGAGRPKSHVSARYEYSNIQAPKM